MIKEVVAMLLVGGLFLLPIGCSKGGDVPAEASMNGKYERLVQVMECPKDQKTYGTQKDYGKWSGGSWCGQTGKAGYWVYYSPKWYVWENEKK